MNFEKYKTIPLINNTRTIEYYKEIGANKVPWYATEKIHGTNFSFLSDGITVVYAQRGGITDGIFNSQAHVQQIENKILELAKKLQRPIQVVCEFYGRGIVSANGIDYCGNAHKDFIAYDIRFTDTDKYMKYPDNFAAFDEFAIPHPQVLFEGTMDECIKSNVEFDSILAGTYGVKTHAEGAVFKPFVDLRIEPSKDRVILKKVSEKFRETKPVVPTKENKVVDEHEVYIVPRITHTRLGKVAAKIGVSNNEIFKFPKLIDAFASDIQDEIFNEYDIVVNKDICKRLCAPILKKFFLPS